MLRADNHIVAQIIKAEFVIGAKSYVATVSKFSFGEIHIVENQSDTQAQELIKPSHPFGVAAGEVVIDGNHMNALAAERVEVNGQGCDEGFTFAGFHFSDFAFMKTHAAHKLNVEMAHTEHAARRLAADGKSFGQNIFHSFAGLKAFAEFVG